MKRHLLHGVEKLYYGLWKCLHEGACGNPRMRVEKLERAFCAAIKEEIKSETLVPWAIVKAELGL